MSIVGGRFESIVLLYIRKCKNLYEWNIELMFYFCFFFCWAGVLDVAVVVIGAFLNIENEIVKKSEDDDE